MHDYALLECTIVTPRILYKDVTLQYLRIFYSCLSISSERMKENYLGREEILIREGHMPTIGRGFPDEFLKGFLLQFI